MVRPAQGTLPMIRRAFTLIELLVVIAVIAILIAIILPALGHAKRTAESAASKVNLSSWGRVQMEYANDYRDSFVNPFDPKNLQTWSVPWCNIIAQRSLNGGPVYVHDFSDPEYCTETFSGLWAPLVSLYLTSNTDNKALVSPNDTAARLRNAKQVPLNFGVEDEFLYATSYWAPPTLWLSTVPFKTASRVPIGPADSRYWRRNRFDNAITPTGKVMVFERFDFTKTTRPSRAGGREKFHPMFNNPEATTRFVTVDGSVSEIQVSKLFALTAATNPNQAERDLYTPAGFWDIPDATLGDPDASNNQPRPLLGRDGLENGDGTMLGILGGFNSYQTFFWGTRNGIQGRDFPR